MHPIVTSLQCQCLSWLMIDQGNLWLGADVLPVSRSLSSDHSAAPVGVSTSPAPSDPAVVVAATPHCVTEVRRVGSGSGVPRPPAGFRGYPVSPRCARIGGVPSQ